MKHQNQDKHPLKKKSLGSNDFQIRTIGQYVAQHSQEWRAYARPVIDLTMAICWLYIVLAFL